MARLENFKLTFVIQGAIDRTRYRDSCVTQDLIRSIRNYYPESKLVLSTWEDESTTEFECFENIKIIKSKDPGGLKFGDEKLNNINRMIVSSINGLKVVETDYVVRVRSDLILKNDKLFDYFDKFNEFEEGYKLVKSRVNVISYSSVDPVFSNPRLLFHPCDWVQIGFLEDVIKFYDIPLLTGKDASYFSGSDSGLEFICRYRAEQYIFLHFLKNNGVTIDGLIDAYSYNSELHKSSNNYLVNNLVVVDATDIGLASLKHRNISLATPSKLNHADWKELYLNINNEGDWFTNARRYIKYPFLYFLARVIDFKNRSRIIRKLYLKFFY